MQNVWWSHLVLWFSLFKQHHNQHNKKNVVSTARNLKTLNYSRRWEKGNWSFGKSNIVSYWNGTSFCFRRQSFALCMLKLRVSKCSRRDVLYYAVMPLCVWVSFVLSLIICLYCTFVRTLYCTLDNRCLTFTLGKCFCVTFIATMLLLF